MNLIELIGPVSLIVAVYIIIGIIVYYIFILTKFKKRKSEIMNSYQNLKLGDEVVVLGGIYGKIISINNDICEIELNKNNVIKVSRYAITQVVR